MKKAFGKGNLEFSLEGANRHKFELNEKGILGERKETEAETRSHEWRLSLK